MSKWSRLRVSSGNLGPQLLELILDFILDLIWDQNNLDPFCLPKPNKMRVPQEIRRRLSFGGLECDIFEPLLGYILADVWGG